MPRVMKYSLEQTGQPTIPVRTMRSFTSPVDRTSISSRCGSGHLRISVSSMWMANRAPGNTAPWGAGREDVARTEPPPRQLPSFDSPLPEDALAVDLDTEDIRPGRDVGDGEVLVVHRIGMVARTVEM